MPQIRCPKCGQAYDVPGVIAVRLTSSIATCTCGEWLAGSKAAVLARTMDTEKIREIDMRPYRVGELVLDPDFGTPAAPPPLRPRSVRITARGTNESINTVFTIHQHPLWIGRKGCHVELAEAELSIRHCSITVEGEELVVRDAHSHMGTYLDGQVIDEATLGSGLHLLRLGSALVSVEAIDEEGLPVEPIALDNLSVVDESVLAAKRRGRPETAAPGARVMLVCVEGPLVGQEFEVPVSGLTVGREGHVRVPDEFLSRKHFEIVRDIEGAVRVRDLGSRNGTFLNTLPARNTKIQPGDEITAGVNRFRIETK